METVDAAESLRPPDGVAFASQTLAEEKGHAMTLLVFEDQDDLPSLPTFQAQALIGPPVSQFRVMSFPETR